jgi:hypothetical protein
MAHLEEDIAAFVGNYTRRKGYPPTVEELIMNFGTFKVMVAMLYVLNLYRIGMIRNSLFFGTNGLRLLPVRTMK